MVGFIGYVFGTPGGGVTKNILDTVLNNLFLTTAQGNYRRARHALMTSEFPLVLLGIRTCIFICKEAQHPIFTPECHSSQNITGSQRPLCQAHAQP